MNIYIIYKISSNLNNFAFALEDCLFGAVKLTKNSDINKYKYSVYDITLNLRGSFLFLDGIFAQNVVIFGDDISSSVHANNNTKNILVIGEGLTQGLNDTALTAEKINQLILLYHNGVNS